jgi:hypothetical protein
MTKPRRLAWALLLALGLGAVAQAEQMQRIGSFEAHYSVVPTMFLKPDVAARYGITRGRDRALVNVAVLDRDDAPVRAAVSGRIRNLLEQDQPLEFREVTEGEAVYYLAEIRHGDRDVLRFAIDIETPDQTDHLVEFQQRMYWDGR